MKYERYWAALVLESHDLIDASEKAGQSFVYLNRARAVIEIDEELKRLREIDPVGPSRHD